MYISDAGSVTGTEVSEADTREVALARLSLTQVTREGDEETVRRLLELYTRENTDHINSLDDSKVIIP